MAQKMVRKMVRRKEPTMDLMREPKKEKSKAATELTVRRKVVMKAQSKVSHWEPMMAP